MPGLKLSPPPCPSSLPLCLCNLYICSQSLLFLWLVWSQQTPALIGRYSQKRKKRVISPSPVNVHFVHFLWVLFQNDFHEGTSHSFCTFCTLVISLCQFICLCCEFISDHHIMGSAASYSPCVRNGDLSGEQFSESPFPF